MIWFGEGRWSWNDLYYMPIHLRRFWLKKINKIIDNKKQASKAQQRRKNPTPLPTKRRQ